MRPATTCVDVWWTALHRAGVADLGSRLLDDDDRRRADGLRVDAARRTFVAGRWLLRSVLGESSDVDPREVRFSLGEHGRPRLAWPEAPDLDFNLSHSHGLIAAAVVRGGRVGIDLERLREVASALRLARRFFAPTEAAEIEARTGADRDHAFLAIWTAKEAWLKATGRGISVRLATVEVEPDPDLPPRLLALPDDDPARWSLHRVPLPLDAVCTVAVAGTAAAVEIHEWRP